MTIHAGHAFLKFDGQAVCFFPRCAAGNPCPQSLIFGTRLDQFLKPRPQRFPGLSVAEEAGHADQEFLKEKVDLRQIFLHVPDVFAGLLDLMHIHAPFEAPDRAFLVTGEVVIRANTQHHEHLLQGNIVHGRRFGCEDRRRQMAPLRVRDQLLRHPRHGQYIIRQPRVGGARGHAAVLRGAGLLHHGHSGCGLDRFHAQGAVCSCTRQNDADRPLLLVLRQRTKKVIDRRSRTFVFAFH